MRQRRHFPRCLRECRQQRGRGHRQAQHLPAIGFQQHILHAEGHGADEHDRQQPRCDAESRPVESPARRMMGNVARAFGGNRAVATAAVAQESWEEF